MTQKLSRAVAAVFTAGLAVQFAHADLILSDSVLTGADPNAGEYTEGPTVRLSTQGPTIPGYAAGSTWGSGTITSQPQVVSGTLDAPGASYEAGGKIQFDGSAVDANYRSRARALATPYTSASANGPLFLSGMISTDAFPDAPANVGQRGYSLFGFTNAVGANATSATLAGYFLGFRANTDDSLDLILRHRDATTTTLGDIVLYSGATAGTTYQFMVKTDVNVIGGNQETVHWWVNPTDVTSEATATSSALASGTFNDYSLQNATQDISRITVATYRWDANTYFDEFRLGTTFADVAGAPVAPPHFAGDTNNDGVVDLVDLNNVLNNFGASGANPGDDNSDGVVDLVDLNNVLNNFGATHAASALSVVPEPASLSLLAIGAAGLLARRRRA